MSFSGFYQETFEFLFEISFNNNVEWFNENRKRYEKYVRDPMRALAAELMPTALAIDPSFNPSITSSVSRIRRDTRFTYDKSPFRNHMWIGFRYPKTRVSEGCAFYFEITPDSYSYGMGFYSTAPAFMAAYRKRVLSDPAGFLALAKKLESQGFIYDNEQYKRDHFPDASPELKPYLNARTFVWNRQFKGVTELIAPSDIADRLKNDFRAMQPMYELMQSVLSTVPPEVLR